MRRTIVFAVVWLAASGAEAGTIAISITHSAERRDGELRATLTVTNTGDEAAHSVTPMLRFRGAETRGETQKALPPNQPLEASLAVPTGELPDGHWPYQIAVDYADANLYPFQALSVATLVVGSPPLPKIAVPALPSPVVTERGELALRVKNLSAAERRAGVRVLVPEAVEATQVAEEIALGPWEEKQLAVPLTNRTALPGSRYPVFVVVEYDDGAVHQAVVAQTSLEIRPADAYVGARGRNLWIAAAVFGVLFAGLLAFRLTRR